MKTQKNIFALLMLIVSFTIQAQTIDPASEWRVNYTYWEPELFVDHYFYKYFINGDTIIDSKDYLKIFKSGYFYRDMTQEPDYNYFENIFSGFLLAENDKWFVFEGNQEMLLYDFNLNVDDTVYSAYSSNPENPEVPIIITAIDSVVVNNIYKKRFHLNLENGAGYIIEDIGATSGLFENMFFFNSLSELICFAENGISLWGASTEECDLAVLINESNALINPCTIFPNPAQDFTRLIIPDGFGEVACTLIDLFGRIVYQGSFESPSTNNIQLSPYLSGIYLAIIETKEWRQAVKLIIE